MLGFRSLLKQPKTRPTQTRTKARTTTALHRWIERAQATGIASIQNFVCQVRRDILAVEAAVTEKWSNGPVEGQVNRLKTIKRQMYGRAGVELLRARLIPLPAEHTRLQRD
jgi:transposase